MSMFLVFHIPVKMFDKNMDFFGQYVSSIYWMHIVFYVGFRDVN